MTDDTKRIVNVILDTPTGASRRPEIAHEQRVALFDFLEDNRFEIKADGVEGPYHLHLRFEGNKLILDVRSVFEDLLIDIPLPLKPLQRIIRDYYIVCDSYNDAIGGGASPSRIEAIDMGRRGLHNDGAAIIQEQLDGLVAIDTDTARRLFTLICVLRKRSPMP